MLNRLMLDKKTADKIEIYKKILGMEPGVYNFFNLSHLWDISYAKTFATVHEINQELAKMTAGSLTLINAQQKVVCTPELPFAGVYIAYQLQQEVPFHFLIELLKERFETLDAFAENYHFSLSTVRRRLQPLLNFLRSYGVNIKLSSMRVLGEERVIRGVLVTLLWECARNGATFTGPLDESKVHQAIADTLSAAPENQQISSMQQFTVIDANVTHYRTKNGHFVVDDARYDWLLPPNLIREPAIWGELLAVPDTYVCDEARYMAFRQFFGTVFFEKADPLQVLLFERLEASVPYFSNLMEKFRSFIEKEMLGYYMISKDHRNSQTVLWSNLVLVFTNYLVFQSKLPFPYLMVESEELEKSAIYNSLHTKIKRFFRQYTSEPGLRWLSNCLDDMSKIFATLLLPEYEQASSKFKLRVAVLPEERYIALHRLEIFLHSLSYISLYSFDREKMSNYDVLVGSATLLESLNVRKLMKCFEWNGINEGHSFLNLEVFLKKAYVDKNTF